MPDWQDIEVPDDDELAEFVAALTGAAGAAEDLKVEILEIWTCSTQFNSLRLRKTL